MAENDHLKAAADAVYQQLANNPEGVPVDPDVIDFMGLPEASNELNDDDGDIQVAN